VKLFISTLIVLLLIFGSTSITFAQNTPSTECLGGVPSVYKNGMWWAWASSCSGGCSSASPEMHGFDKYGWRWVSGEEEWNLKPDKSAFGISNNTVDKCASEYFDSKLTTCNALGTPVYFIDGKDNELWLVRDKCEENGETYLSSSTALVILLGLGIFAFSIKD